MIPNPIFQKPDIYFTDFFEVSEKDLSEYGAFNVSPLVDLPLFIDPFLLFTSDKPEYQSLHEEIIDYLAFLRDKSITSQQDRGALKAWYCFKEVHQNCLGFCLTGTHGAGLGIKFAEALSENLGDIFRDFGDEKITDASHLEKLVLIRTRVGKDNISDFTTNLIKDFLLTYTEAFALEYIDPKYLKKHKVPRSYFNYKIGVWLPKEYTLPTKSDGEYVVLTPEDILTKDDTWINKSDLRHDFSRISESIPNDALRSQINTYFKAVLPKKATNKDVAEAKEKTLRKYPELMDYFIKLKEDSGDQAKSLSSQKVETVAWQFIEQVKQLLDKAFQTPVENYPESTKEETLDKIMFLKHVIENQDGYRIFYGKDGEPFKRENDLQILFKLVWHGSPSSADAEVNNGRGPVDFKVSRGSADSSLVEFKLAKNSKLAQNLENQVEVYKKANNTITGYKVILVFSDSEALKVRGVLKKLKISGDMGVIIIDARRDNKPSASIT